MGSCCTSVLEEEKENEALLTSKKIKKSPKITSVKRKIPSVKNSEEPEKIGVSDFKLLTLLGEGNFGKVYQVCKLDTNEIYAMKVLSKQKLKESNQLEHTITERSVLQQIEHPFLVNLRFAFQTTDKLYMVMGTILFDFTFRFCKWR